MNSDYSKSMSRCLDVIRSIAGVQEATVEQLADAIGTTTRNVYYMIRALREYGFIIHRVRGRYSLDAHSSFFQEIARSVSFTYDQANYIYGLLNSVDSDTAIAGLLKRKMQRYYHIDEAVEVGFKPAVYKNVSMLKRAIKLKRLVKLRNYSSSHSKTTTDRIVEPFLFLGDETDIRAYEIKSHMNKSFKISRIGSVELMKDNWFNADKHRQVFTDMFLYSGEERHHVVLRFDLPAHNLMQEEYPHSGSMMKQEDDNHWLFETDVVSYRAIGRFVLGLYDNVQVIDDDGLKAYLLQRVEKMYASMHLPAKIPAKK